MTKSKFILLLISITIILFTLSCKKVVQSEFPDIVQKPVVNSILMQDSTISINVSLSGKLDPYPIEFVENAVVSLYVDDVFQQVLIYDNKGMYNSNIIAQADKKYSCKVEIPGYKTLNCSTIIPHAMEISKVSHKNSAYIDAEGTIYPAVTITFDNNPDTALYFQVLIKLFIDEYSNQRSGNRTGWLVGIKDPVLLNEGIDIGIFSNQMIKDNQYTMSLNYFSGHGNWNMAVLFPLVVELRTISFEYYTYLRSLHLFSQGIGNNNLSGTTVPFPVYSNIDGGLGIFAGYSSYSTDTVFPENYQIHQ